MKVRLTESQLRDIITKTINESMNEWTDVAGFPTGFVAKKGNDWKRGVMDKYVKQSPDLDPAGFQWFGDVLKHNGKKRPKATPKPKIAKPEGMDDITYITKFAPKYNKRLANGLQKLRQHSDESKEQWDTLDVSHLRSGDVAQAFSDRYYISNFGGIAISNPTNTSNCHVFVPYFDKSTKKYQINLRIYDGDVEVEHLCPSVASLVRQNFGDEWAQHIVDLERQELQNGTAVLAGEDTDF